jgi:Protein of unknown function (DUF1091)
LILFNKQFKIYLIQLLFQFCYLRYDKVRTQNFAPDRIFVNFSVKVTPDRKSGLVSGIWEYKESCDEIEERVKLFRAADDQDYDVSHYIFGFTMSYCRFSEMAERNIVVRMMAENFLSSINANFSCPIKKGTTLVLNNMLVTDKFLPPMPIEQRFRLEFGGYGKHTGQKKFGRFYKVDYYLKVKKLRINNVL